MPPLQQPVTYLSPPKGPTLVLTDNETWLGRGSFELSEKAQLLCSRRQACLRKTKTTVTLECHGLNPIYFVVCHSVNFQASDTPPSRLHQLRKGEAVELVDGDKFFLAPKECLLTVTIEPFNSEYDEASHQLKPAAVKSNLQDDTSLADQVCSPKSTQLGQAFTNSPVKQHRLLQTGLPARKFSTEVCIELAGRCFTGEICVRSPTVDNCCGCSPAGSCRCNDVRNGLLPPSELQVVSSSPVRRVDSENDLSRDATPSDVVVDTKRSIDVSKIGVIADCQHTPENCTVDSSIAGDPFNPTHGSTLAAGSFVQGKSCGSSIYASESILIRNFQPDTISCVDSRVPSELRLNSNSDASEGSKPVIARNVSDCTSAPPLAVSGDPAPVEVDIGTRRSNSADQVAIESDGGRNPNFFRSDSSAAGGASSNSTERCTLGASISVEGRGCGSSNDITGNTYRDTSECGFDSGGPPDQNAKSLPSAHEAGKRPITRNVSGCTFSPLCPKPDQVQVGMPSAIYLQQCSILPGQPCNPCGIPVITGFPAEEGASTLATIPVKPRAAKMSETLMEEYTEPNFPLKLPPDGSSSDVPITICDVQDGRELLPRKPEFVDLTISENEENNQAQTQSQTAQVGQSTCNRTGHIEGMTKVIVTVSGYQDLLRARLINLISATGASYTGSLTKVNTHVVCWKFRGAKYEMAKKLGKTIVNHCWFEDCQRAGILLPEGSYNASGEMSEPLQWDQSSVQYPSSTAEFDHDQDCNSLLSGPPLGQARLSILIGESSRSVKTAAHSGQSTLSPKSHIGSLDRGKRPVDLNSSENRAYACQEDRQIRALTRTGDSPAVDLSTPHRAQEQESDDFWNEVIRGYDDRSSHVTEHSFEVFSELNNGKGLARPRHAASAIPGSSLRELDPYHSEIGSERRNFISNLALSSRNVEDAILQGTMQPLSEQTDNMQSEADPTTSYPEVFQRKRKHALEIATIKYRRWKYRRLVKKAGVSAASRHLPSHERNVFGTMPGITTGGQPTFNSGPALEQASTLDTNDDCQQTSCGISADSVGKTGEKGGESAPSNEITCVICHSDTQLMNEGVLACGHQFCYPCIQRWADEARSKSPTCPLCKVPFDFITFREMGQAGEDGSCAIMEERIVQIGQQIPQETRFTSLPSLRIENLCVTCGSRDTPELLLICTNCRERACHTFCLDPPRPPGSCWFCSRCTQMQSRMQTREAYGRIFHGSSPQYARRRQDTADGEMEVALQSRSTTHVGELVVGQSSGVPMGTNPASQGGSNSRMEELLVGQSSRTPSRRGRQYSLHRFLVRQNDV